MDKKKNNNIKQAIISLALVAVFGYICFGTNLLDDAIYESVNHKSKKIKLEKLELPRNGKNITVYKYESKQNPNLIFYGVDPEKDVSDEKTYNIDKVGSFITLTNENEVVEVSKDYALVYENNSYSLYNYNSDTLIITDFAKDNKPEEDISLLTDSNDSAHGIIYSKDKSVEIYNLDNKEIKEFNGKNIDYGIFDSRALNYKNLIALEDNGTIIYYDYTTGKKVFDTTYTPENVVGCNNEVFIHFIDTNKKSYIVNSKGNKVLTELNNISQISYIDDELVVISDNKYYIYDYKLNKKFESKQYTNVIMTGSKFALVVSGTNLELVDLKDNLLTTFINDYTNTDYIVHTKLSGWYTDNNKKGIYFVVETNKVTLNEVMNQYKDMDRESLLGYDLGYDFYYIPDTKETGRIPTYIGGYAKS